MDPITWSAVWALAKKFALPIALAVSVISAWHFQSRAEYWHGQQVECSNGRIADQKAFKQAAADASKKNQQEVADTETHWKGVVADTENSYDEKLNSAYASVRDYANRLRIATSQASGSDTGESDLPEVAGPSGPPLGAGAGSLVPVPEGDLNVCAENTVKAQEWQRFYQGLRDAGR